MGWEYFETRSAQGPHSAAVPHRGTAAVSMDSPVWAISRPGRDSGGVVTAAGPAGPPTSRHCRGHSSICWCPGSFRQTRPTTAQSTLKTGRGVGEQSGQTKPLSSVRYSARPCTSLALAHKPMCMCHLQAGPRTPLPNTSRTACPRLTLWPHPTTHHTCKHLHPPPATSRTCRHLKGWRAQLAWLRRRAAAAAPRGAAAVVAAAAVAAVPAVPAAAAAAPVVRVLVHDHHGHGQPHRCCYDQHDHRAPHRPAQPRAARAQRRRLGVGPGGGGLRSREGAGREAGGGWPGGALLKLPEQLGCWWPQQGAAPAASALSGLLHVYCYLPPA